MINIQNVTFSYSKKSGLLSDINLNIGEGRIHGLLGKNGEGKSTLLKLISGLVFPQSGKIFTFGENPVKRNPSMNRAVPSIKSQAI